MNPPGQLVIDALHTATLLIYIYIKITMAALNTSLLYMYD